MAFFSTPEQRLAQQQAALDRAEKDPTAPKLYTATVRQERDRQQQAAAAAVPARRTLPTAASGPATGVRYAVGQGATGVPGAPSQPVMTRFLPPRAAPAVAAAAPAAVLASLPDGPMQDPAPGTAWTSPRRLPAAAGPTAAPAAAPARSGAVGAAGASRATPSVTMLENGAAMPEHALRAPRTLATAATAAGGIKRGVDARGNRVYSDSDTGLAEGIALADGGMGTGKAAPTGGYAGITRTLSGASAAAAPEVGAAQQGPRVLSAAVPTAPVAGRQGAVIQNPGDTTADKLQRALTSYSVKGSPSTRAAIAQAILGEAGARQNERMQTLRTQDQAALEAQRSNAAAAEGNANRQLDADKFNVSAQDSREYRRQMVDLERTRPFQVGQGEDGAQGIVRADGSYTPITDASGAPVQINQRGQALSPDALLKSYTDQANAISNGMGTAEEKRAARAELDANPMFAPILGSRKVNNVTPSRDQFLEQARKANPGVGDAELIAYYDKTYGS